MAKVGEVDVAIRLAARADVPLLAQSFDVKKADGSLFKTADTLTSFMERHDKTTFFEREHGGTGRTRKMSFAFPTGNTDGTVKCYIVNKQRNGMERFLAAPAPVAPVVVEDENFVETRALVPLVAAPPGDFLALMGSMLDKKMEAQSINIDEMKAQSAGMRNDIRDELAALENQLGKSLSEELVPLKK